MKINGRSRWRLQLLAPVIGMVLLVALAIVFAQVVVKIQAASAAYLGGQSIWSRAQLATVYHLERYSRSGDHSDLFRARQWLAIPLADRRARLAMEATPMERAEARDGMLAGDNHPHDVDDMIWLFHHFADWGRLREAVEVWRASDAPILRLKALAGELERTWAATAAPDRAELNALRAELARVNRELQTLTADFRHAMTAAARWVARVLSVASVVFLMLIIVLAAALSAWTLRILRRSESRFRAIFEQAAVGIAQLDDQGVIQDVNPAFAHLLRRERQALVGQPFRSLILSEDRARNDELEAQLQSGDCDRYTAEQQFVCGEGGCVRGRVTASVGAGRERVMILEDISESHRLSQELNFQATHDALTGLFNRRAFENRLRQTLERARSEASRHTLGFIDLDQFKIVNDTSGHFAGDQLLQQVVSLFQGCLREGDMLARLGGDEFGVILEHCDLPTASRVAEKLRAALDKSPFSWEGDNYDISCSIGLVPIHADTPDIEHLLKSADIACYLAKEQGRNRVHLSSEDDEAQRERLGEMQWVNRIRAALAENRLFLEAQRIIPLAGDATELCYEVLVRLRSEHSEVVPPGAFLPAAERFGVVHQIDRWVIREVIQRLAEHPRHLARLRSCHVNLSGQSLDQPDFADFVSGTLQEFGVPPEKICFEITETAAVNNLSEALAFMERLGGLGCHFALDDFGTGLSSFSYLRRLPIDCLKIDGVFVRDIVEDETDRAMVRAINEIGQTLGKQTIAEFVETEAAAACLRSMGVNAAQGYGLHRPCAFETLLAEATLATESLTDSDDFGAK